MRNRFYAVLVLLALGIVLVIVVAGQRAEDGDKDSSLESSVGLFSSESAGLEDAASSTGSAQWVDALDDAVDCVQTLTPTGQSLPAHADIAEVLWEKAGDLVRYEIRYATEDLPAVLAELEALGEGDFIGFALEFLDPQGTLTSDADTGWMPDRMGNLSLNLIRNPDTGVFSGARYEVKAGSWQQIPGVAYPVEMTADSFIMTIPASAIPPEAKGFVASILFDVSSAEIFCDLAALDEELLGQQLSPNPDNFISGIVFNISAGREPTGELPYSLAGPNGFK